MLLEGEDVGHDLARMRGLGQPVDHRHRRVLGELEHHRVVEDADHDRVDIARQHPRRVGDGLAAAELHLLAGEHEGLAAELAHRHVEGDARAGRGLVEDHRQGLAGERPVLADLALAAVGLEGGARLEHAAKLGAGEVLEVEEIAFAVDHSAAPRRASARISSSSASQVRSSRATASPISASPTISGGKQPHDVVAGRDGEELLAARRVDEVGVRHMRAQPEHQALAAQLGDHRRMAVHQRREALLQKQAHLPDVIEEARREHDVEDGVADRHGERVAAEGRAMDARGHALGGLGGREARPHRETAADALGDRHDVGLDAAPLMREQPAGAPDAGLHLVEDEEHAMFVAELAQAAQALRRDVADAALALHRLDQDGAGLAA